MRVKYYQASWLDKNGGFRVNGSVSKDPEEAVRTCQNHSAVKSGAKLQYIDEWWAWED